MAEPAQNGVSGCRRARRLLVTAVATAVLMIAASPVAAHAYVRYGYKLKYGVGNYGASDQHYWVDSSASGYLSTIDSAMNDWVYTTSRLGITTPISYTRTSVKTSSRMDIYAVSSIAGAPPGALAQTTWYNGTTLADPTTTNWVWGKIRIIKPTYDGLSAFNKKGTASHEMGHVMGLGENNTMPGSVMCQLGYGRTVNNAQKDDANGINAIY